MEVTDELLLMLRSEARECERVKERERRKCSSRPATANSHSLLPCVMPCVKLLYVGKTVGWPLLWTFRGPLFGWDLRFEAEVEGD
jgi:hypothetical protein